MITIISNGGGKVLPIEALFDRLASDTLDRMFEAYGNFVQRDPIGLDGSPLYPAGTVSFFGNFFTYSHVFNIATDEPDLIERLVAAIDANRATYAYRFQAPPYQKRLLEIVRHRFSETQGEVSLIYNGETLERFGDDIQINGNGRFEGRRDHYWHDVAKRLLKERHEASMTTCSRPAYVQTHSGLHLACLDQASHDRTCGYWYTVTSNGTAHTAFQHLASLLRWAKERGLTLPDNIPAPGTRGSFKIGGEYRSALHMNAADFYALDGERSRGLQNGDWTLAVITADSDGLRTVHKLNPNVSGRPVYDHAQSRAAFG